MVGHPARPRGQHFADFGQSEPEPLALQNQREPVTVCAAKDTGAAVALGRQQALALVKSQCSQCHARLARKLADGKISRDKRLRRRLVAAAGSVDTAVGLSAVFVLHVTPTYYLPRIARTLGLPAPGMVALRCSAQKILLPCDVAGPGLTGGQVSKAAAR